MRRHPMIYPLEWLDEVINTTLNPANTDIHLITEEQATWIAGKTNKEIKRNIIFLQTQLFAFTGKRQIKQFLSRYRAAVIFLINRQVENTKNAEAKEKYLQDLYHTILSNLEGLMSFIETRFSVYLSLKEQAPATYLSMTKTALAKSIRKLEKNLAPQIGGERLRKLLFQALHAFVNSTSQERCMTYRGVLYMKTLVEKLEQLDTPQKVTDTYTALDELLIYLNFNHKPYLDYFTHHLSENINAVGSIGEKLDFLLYYHKSFRQLQRQQHMVFNPAYKNLKEVLNNWFEQEIRYLKQKLRLSETSLPVKQDKVTAQPKKEYVKQKITCQLSSDQMALIIRSLDDLRIISARSLNDVFRNIVPHLSTPYKQELSYEAMRNKSYMAETRDQKIAIETLEKMIQRIKEY